jgi:hypothetical protein
VLSWKEPSRFVGLGRSLANIVGASTARTHILPRRKLAPSAHGLQRKRYKKRYQLLIDTRTFRSPVNGDRPCAVSMLSTTIRSPLFQGKATVN